MGNPAINSGYIAGIFHGAKFSRNKDPLYYENFSLGKPRKRVGSWSLATVFAGWVL